VRDGSLSDDIRLSHRFPSSYGRGHNIPAIYPHSDYVRRGGLISHGAKAGIAEKIVVDCVVRVLQGAKPANLPIQQATEFDLVINL
jgi:putative ABC transport system substrate-binding protein